MPPLSFPDYVFPACVKVVVDDVEAAVAATLGAVPGTAPTTSAKVEELSHRGVKMFRLCCGVFEDAVALMSGDGDDEEEEVMEDSKTHFLAHSNTASWYVCLRSLT